MSSFYHSPLRLGQQAMIKIYIKPIQREAEEEKIEERLLPDNVRLCLTNKWITCFNPIPLGNICFGADQSLTANLMHSMTNQRFKKGIRSPDFSPSPPTINGGRSGLL